MRTRGQDKAEAEAAAAAAAAAAEEPSSASSSSSAHDESEHSSSLAGSSKSASHDHDTQISATDATAPPEAQGSFFDSAGIKLRSRLPRLVQLPLVALLSVGISALGNSISWDLAQSDLSAHVRILRTWPEFGVMTVWRLFVLALGWFGNQDAYDITALNFLSQGPHLYLLFAHYHTPPYALLIIMAIETLATFVPYRLLRPLSSVHANPKGVPNSDILTDTPILLLTTLLAGAIYSVSLILAYSTYLPTYMVLYFVNLPSVERAHESTWISLLPVTIMLGFAARAFIFTPAEATGRTAADEKIDAFNPAKATLGETLQWNFFSWSSQTKVATRRTVLLMLVTGVNTFLQTQLTIVGVETAGALAWSSVWVFASAIAGFALGAVGSV